MGLSCFSDAWVGSTMHLPRKRSASEGPVSSCTNGTLSAKDNQFSVIRYKAIQVKPMLTENFKAAYRCIKVQNQHINRQFSRVENLGRAILEKYVTSQTPFTSRSLPEKNKNDVNFGGEDMF